MSENTQIKPENNNNPAFLQQEEGRYELQQQVRASLDAIRAWETAREEGILPEPKPRIRAN